MKILISAFEPFGADSQNSALLALLQLPEQTEDARIIRVILPTVYLTSVTRITEAIEEVHPDAVLCLGQYVGAKALRLERVAVNLDDAQRPDNAGDVRIDRPIVPDGPAAYFTTLPVRPMLGAMEAAAGAAVLSYTAGTYVCNHVMYSVLHLLRDRPDVMAGFLHIPATPQQVQSNPDRAGTPSLPTETAVRGIIAAVRVICSRSREKNRSTG